MINKWTKEMDQRGLYNGGKSSIRGDRKILREKLNKIYCSTGKNIPSEIANPSKNLLLGLEFNL